MKPDLRLASAGSLLALVAVLASMPASHETAAAPDDEPGGSRIPFLLRNNHILVRGTVGDSDSLWFIVDTGASGHVLNASTAKRLGLRTEEGATAGGAGGQVAASRVHGARLRLPGVELDASPLMAIPLDLLALKTGHPCDGVVGYEFFAERVVTIDYDAGQLVLRPAKAFRPPAGSAMLPLTLRDNHPYAPARVTLPGGEPVEGSFLLDTGSVLSLILSPSFVAEHKALERVPRTIQVQLGGVGGPTRHPLGRIGKLELGPHALDAPTAVLRQVGPGSTNAEETAGNIGGEVLSRFRVTFDYAGRRLYLEPGRTLGDPFESDKSGLALSPREDGSGRIDVILVQEGSPAAEQGVAVGDELETVDGRPIAPAGLLALRQRLREDGRTLRLGLRRGEARSDVTLTTRRLL
jgi:predicted aspartyl protease